MILKAIKKKKKRLSCCLLSAYSDLSCYVKLFMNACASRPDPVGHSQKRSAIPERTHLRKSEDMLEKSTIINHSDVNTREVNHRLNSTCSKPILNSIILRQSHLWIKRFPIA